MAIQNESIYKILIEGKDETNCFLTTYEVKATSKEAALGELNEVASREGWELVDVDEIESIEFATSEERVRQLTGRSYFG